MNFLKYPCILCRSNLKQVCSKRAYLDVNAWTFNARGRITGFKFALCSCALEQGGQGLHGLSEVHVQHSRHQPDKPIINRHTLTEAFCPSNSSFKQRGTPQAAFSAECEATDLTPAAAKKHHGPARTSSGFPLIFYKTRPLLTHRTVPTAPPPV